MRRTTPLLMALTLVAALLAMATTASANGQYPEVPVPPTDDWDGTDIRSSLAWPAGDDGWYGGFASNNNLPPILDFDTTMGPVEQQIADEMLAHINAERTARGLRTVVASQPGVDYSTALAHRNSAIDRTFHSDEVTTDTLEFYFPNWFQDGSNVGGYPRSAGENVGGADGVNDTSGDMVRAYMGSSYHRTSLLGGNFDAIGIGVACQVVHYDSGQVLGVMKTVIVPVRTQALPPSWQDPSYGPYPLGNPPAGAPVITQANEGTPCFELPPGCNGLGPDDCVGAPTTSTVVNPTTSTTSTTGGTGPSGPTIESPTEIYVKAVYQLFLGRQPSSVELTAGMAWVQNNGRSALTDNLSTSTEWAGVVIDGIYDSALSRNPDAGGRAFWVAQLDAGASTRAVAVSIYGSPEAYELAGGTNAGYAEYLYDRILLRNPDAGGLAFWTGRLDAGVTPAELVAGFWDSIEFRRNRVQGVYQDVLGRDPDAGGWAYWADQLLTIDEVRLASQHAASDEFYNRAQQG